MTGPKKRATNHTSHRSQQSRPVLDARILNGPQTRCRYLCLRTDWHRALDGAIVDVDLMVSCKAQTILQRAVCIAQSTVCTFTLEEMALAAVS